MFFLCFSLDILIGIYYFVSVLLTLFRLELMKAKIYKLVLSALSTLLPLWIYGQSEETKKDSIIENIYPAKNVRQNTNYWCVYACLESITPWTQCFHCEQYINRFLLSDYKMGHNPYPSSYMSDKDFKEAMTKFDSLAITPCQDQETFEKFGAKVNDLKSFIGNEIYYTDLCNLFQTKIIGYSILAVSTEGENAHCVAIQSSKTYGTVRDPRSTVTIMDPYRGTITLKFKDFENKYYYFYSPAPTPNIHF